MNTNVILPFKNALFSQTHVVFTECNQKLCIMFKNQ